MKFTAWQSNTMFWHLLDEQGIVVADITPTQAGEHGEVVKRLAACWNACKGIPTSDLEEGRVVVVPAEVARRAMERCRTAAMQARKLREEAHEKRLYHSEGVWLSAEGLANADADVLEATLSRIQQKPEGGEKG